MAKKGRTLEQLVKAIQITLNDRKDLSVMTNVKLKNSNGIYREFDVVLKNNNDKYIVFECKDFSTSKKQHAIDIQYIDSLDGKCSNMPQIIRKIIVSTTGFTKNAHIEAISKGIELYTINDVPLTQIANTLKNDFIHINYTILKSHYCLTKSDDSVIICNTDEVISIYESGNIIDIAQILNAECDKHENEILKLAANTIHNNDNNYGYFMEAIEVNGSFQIKTKWAADVLYIKSIGHPIHIYYVVEECIQKSTKVCEIPEVFIHKYISEYSDIESIIVKGNGNINSFFEDNNTLLPGEEL